MRANAVGRSNGSTAVLNLTRRRAQPLAPYQAYMHLYSDRVMALIKLNYAAYKHGLAEGVTPREWWGFATSEAKRLLEEEPNDVKAAVEAYRELQAQTANPTPFDLVALTTEGADEATKRVRAMQQYVFAHLSHTSSSHTSARRNINRLARTAYEACKAIEEQTGWKASLLMGGPNPETGRMVTLT